MLFLQYWSVQNKFNLKCSSLAIIQAIHIIFNMNTAILKCSSLAFIQAIHIIFNMNTIVLGGGLKPSCQPLMCMMECEYGFVKDSFGCNTCKCRG